MYAVGVAEGEENEEERGNGVARILRVSLTVSGWLLRVRQRSLRTIRELVASPPEG